MIEFRDWIDARIREWDLDTLAEYRTRAPHAARAHPTDEHFQPIFFALGAASDLNGLITGANPLGVFSDDFKEETK